MVKEKDKQKFEPLDYYSTIRMLKEREKKAKTVKERKQLRKMRKCIMTPKQTEEMLRKQKKEKAAKEKKHQKLVERFKAEGSAFAKFAKNQDKNLEYFQKAFFDKIGEAATASNFGIHGFQVCEICGKRKEFSGFYSAIYSHRDDDFYCFDCRDKVMDSDFSYEEMDNLRGFRFCQLCGRPSPFKLAEGEKRSGRFACDVCKKRISGGQ